MGLSKSLLLHRVKLMSNKVIKEVILCGCTPLNPCCPVVKESEELFLIDDDYNNTVKINKKDINSLVENVNKIISEHRSSLDNKG